MGHLQTISALRRKKNWIDCSNNLGFHKPEQQKMAHFTVMGCCEMDLVEISLHLAAQNKKYAKNSKQQ